MDTVPVNHPAASIPPRSRRARCRFCLSTQTGLNLCPPTCYLLSASAFGSVLVQRLSGLTENELLFILLNLYIISSVFRFSGQKFTGMDRLCRVCGRTETEQAEAWGFFWVRPGRKTGREAGRRVIGPGGQEKTASPDPTGTDREWLRVKGLKRIEARSWYSKSWRIGQ